MGEVGWEGKGGGVMIVLGCGVRLVSSVCLLLPICFSGELGSDHILYDFFLFNINFV